MADKNTSNDWLQVGRDFFDETLESITAELPRQNEEQESANPEKNEESDQAGQAEAHSETPEEILARFRARSNHESETKAKEKAKKASFSFGPFKKLFKKKTSEADDGDDDDDDDDGLNTEADEERAAELSKARPRLRNFLRAVITILLTTLIIIILLFRLNAVENEMISGVFSEVTGTISDTVTPVQGIFGQVSDAFVSFFRRIKYWYNLETEYERLREENEQLVYKAMRADELQLELERYEIISADINDHEKMDPVYCSVIGKNGDSYFSTFTINKGRNDGIKEYMAVTLSGALVGYTETVTDNQATVRTIIDSEASIAALIQSSRDQGTIRGTLGVDGTAMCRMYYLPDDHLPRPGDIVVTSGVSMSFPKGIPIGTVRESTRGMDANKQYIVVEPMADFQHIEYVIVLRYQPRPQAISASNNSTVMEYTPLETARPEPNLRIGSLNYFTDMPQSADATETPSPAPSPTPTPQATPTQAPIQIPMDDEPVYEYVIVTPEDPNITPSPTPTATPTPYITLGPDDMTLEEDD